MGQAFNTPDDHVAHVKAGEQPGPLTPTRATMSADRKTIHLVIANASWEKVVPCRVALPHFTARSASAIVLSQHDPEGHPLVDRKEEAVGALPVAFKDNGASLSLPARSVAFVSIAGMAAMNPQRTAVGP